MNRLRYIALGAVIGAFLAGSCMALAAGSVHWPASCGKTTCVDSHLNDLHTQMVALRNEVDSQRTAITDLQGPVASFPGQLASLQGRTPYVYVVHGISNCTSPDPNVGGAVVGNLCQMTFPHTTTNCQAYTGPLANGTALGEVNVNGQGSPTGLGPNQLDVFVFKNGVADSASSYYITLTLICPN